MTDTGSTGGTVDAAAERMRSTIQLSTNLTLVNRTLGRVISALQDIDNLQKSAMSVGIRSSVAMTRMGDTIKNHPGGMKESFESALSLMQVGLFKHSKGMIAVIQQAKVTGQDAQRLISGFATLASKTGISSKAMGILGLDLIELSQDWGIQTTALISALEKNADTLGTLGALGGDTAKNLEGYTEILGKVGTKHADTLGSLVKQFTFKDDFQDVANIMRQTGGRGGDLAARMQTGFTKELAKEFLDLQLKTFDEQVKGNRTKAAEIQAIAKARGFDVSKIEALRAMQLSWETGSTLIQQGIKETNVEYSASIGTMLQELAVPIQTMLIPAANKIAELLKEFRLESGSTGGKVVSFLIRFVTIFTALLALTKLLHVLQQIIAFKSGGLLGMLLGAVALVGAGVAMSMDEAKKTANEDRRDKQAREKLAIDRNKSHERYMTGALIAASMTNVNHFLAVGVTQNENLEKIIFGQEKYGDSAEGAARDAKVGGALNHGGN